MRSPKYSILAAIAAVIGVLGVLAWVAVREMDMMRQEQRITEFATSLIGRKVETRGGLRIGFSLRPTLVAEDVRVANASWGSQPTMLTADRIAVSLELLPLLRGTVDLASVRLSGVRVLLETDAKGRRNWDLGDGGHDRGDGGHDRDDAGIEADVVANHVVVEDLALEIRGPHSKEATSIEVPRLAFSTDDVSQPVSLELRGRSTGTEFAAAGTVGSLADWLSGEKLPLALDFRWGESTFTTDGTLYLGKRPRLRGRVLSGSIDTAEWLAERREHSKPPDHTAARDRMFPTAPLGLAAVGSVNADVSLAVRDVVDGLGRIELTHAKAALEGGVLRLESVRAVVGGAQVEASLEIDARAGVPRVALSFLARELDLGDLLERLEFTDQVEALVDVAVNVGGRGDSVALLLGVLHGSATLTVRRGEIPRSYVDRLVADLSSLIVPWARPAKRVEIGCAVAQFAIDRGVAQTQALMLDSPRMTLRGRGTIDLGNETLHLDLSPRPRNRKLLTLATDLTLKGPLAQPRAHVSPVGLGTAAARFALGPARLLSPLPGGSTARDRECADRVQAISAGLFGAS